jgi:hypothetical protein
MQGKLALIAMMAVVTVLFVSGCTTVPTETPPGMDAQDYCGLENVATAYECADGYVKVESSLLGGGVTYYKAGYKPRPAGISCPVVGPDAESAECKTLAQLECTDACQGTGPIGGQRDEHGCLGPAGYTWNETIGACVRPWELGAQASEAARIAVEYAGRGYATTVTDVSILQCVGCFGVTIEQGEDRERSVVLIEDWVATQKTVTYHQCTDEEKAAEICTLEYMPVCGYMTNGTVQTYGNDCGACAAGVDYWEDGEC